MGGEDGNEANPPSTRVDILSTELTRHDGQEDLSDAALHEAIANRVRQRLFSGPYPGMEIGRYKLLEIIGEGGMGTVLRALDPQLHRQVALKVLQEQLSHQDEMRLRREAVAMAKLSHPNVVQVYEVGEADDRIFVAMELVSGQTLREWMQGEHSWRECVELFVQLGDGLAAAHECGLVHRDFKPGNALIDEKGRARVLDFGLARQTDADEGDESCGNMASTRPSLIADEAVATSIPLTKTGTVMGTPAYMSPEQFHGAAVDARSDQFSFCMTLYEALHGERPFGQGQLSEIMERIYRTQLSPVPAGHGVPRALRKILLRGMAAVPDSRWSSMDELLVELRALIAPRSHRWFTASLGVGLLVAGGGLVASLYGNADQRCEGSEQQLAGIWDPERRQMLEDAFDKTAAANAAATWTQVEAELDAYATGWIAAHTDACEVAARQQLPRETIEIRNRCLEQRRVGLRETTDGLLMLDAADLPEAMSRVSTLPAVDPCDDSEPPAGVDDGDTNSGSGDDDASDPEPATLRADNCPDDPALELCIRFESVEGKIVHDDADPSIRGRLIGDLAIEPGALGQELVLLGKGGRIPVDFPSDPQGSFSIDFWMWMAQGSPIDGGIVDKWMRNRGYWFGGTSRVGGLSFWVDGISISTEAAPKEQWIHVAGTFDIVTGLMSLYVDGQLMALGQHTGPVTVVDKHPLTIGWAVEDKAAFKGKLDSIRIWSRVLAQQELQPRPAPP